METTKNGSLSMAGGTPWIVSTLLSMAGGTRNVETMQGVQESPETEAPGSSGKTEQKGSGGDEEAGGASKEEMLKTNNTDSQSFASESNDKAGDSNDGQAPEMRLTCDTCLRMKKKCDKTKPHCFTCVRKGYSCVYTIKQKPGRKRMNVAGERVGSKKGKNDGREDGEATSVPPERCFNAIPVDSTPTQLPPELKQDAAGPEFHPMPPQPTWKNVVGFGAEEEHFLNTFLQVFQALIPTTAPSSPASGPPSTSPAGAGQAAEQLGLWSSVAVGAVLLGRRAQLPAYLARVQASAGAGGALGAGAGPAGPGALLRLALLGDALGQPLHALELLAQCGPAAAALGDAALAAAAKLLRLVLVAGSPAESARFVAGALAAAAAQGGAAAAGGGAAGAGAARGGEGGGGALAPEEAARLPWPARVYWEAAFAMAKLPLAFGAAAGGPPPSAEALQAVFHTCYRNLKAAAEALDEGADEYGPLLKFIVQELLFVLEVCCLKEVYKGLDRARSRLLPLLRACPGAAAVSFVATRAHSLAYALHRAGDRRAYAELAALWNHAQAAAGHGGGGGGGGGDPRAAPRPLPAFALYRPDAQCAHFRCRTLNSKIRAAMDAFFLGPPGDGGAGEAAAAAAAAPGAAEGAVHALPAAGQHLLLKLAQQQQAAANKTPR